MHALTGLSTGEYHDPNHMLQTRELPYIYHPGNKNAGNITNPIVLVRQENAHKISSNRWVCDHSLCYESEPISPILTNILQIESRELGEKIIFK